MALSGLRETGAELAWPLCAVCPGSRPQVLPLELWWEQITARAASSSCRKRGRKQVLKNSRPDMILKPGSALSCETRGMSCEVSASCPVKWGSLQPLPGGLAGVDHSWGGQSHCLSGSVPVVTGGALGAPGSWGVSTRLPRAPQGHSLNRSATLSLGRCRGSRPLPPPPAP